METGLNDIQVTKRKYKRMSEYQIGDKYNRLTIIESPYLKYDENLKRNQTMVKCQCDCEHKTTIEVLVSNLTRNHTRSCGCWKREQTIKRNHELYTIHGLSDHPIYKLWIAIRERCYNNNRENYYNYGGKGIVVSDEWLNNPQSFYDWAIQNGWERGLTIERINRNGNYCPENCTFATCREQANNRCTNTFITAFGETKTIANWARDFRCKVQYTTLFTRITVLKWDDPETAMTTPVRKYAKR